VFLILFRQSFLKKQNKILAQMVENRTNALKELNESLEEKVKEEVEKNRKSELRLLEQSKMVSMGEMIGNIAHQWRQPLSVITINTSAISIKRDMGELDDKYLDDALNSINRNVKYLSETIDTFRDFVKDNKELKEVVLQKTINTTINIIKDSLKNHHIELINKIDYKHDINITLTKGELEQVMLNIINNARDILVENKIDNPWIKIALTKEDKKVIITIEDNGGGVPQNILPKIFEPYFTTKHQSKGTGLGLHMSYKIITESLHGDLYVKNSQNGAKFFIELLI
jgi:signal transduction histidine kinase